MAIPRMFSRVRMLLLALILACVFIWSLSRSRNPNTAYSNDVTAFPPNSESNVAHSTAAHIAFWRQFKPLLTGYEPQCPPPDRLGTAASNRFSMQDPERRPELLDMMMEDVDNMKSAHGGFVDHIKKNPPQLQYTPNTRGLVSTAGGSYLPVLVISLRMLRKTGSTLPVEIFLADSDEYEEYTCGVVLPSLNAKCVVLSEILDAVPGVKEIEKYQFKPFAMLFSSFEEILFLDADAFPLEKPESLFVNEPFKSKNMVTWPDFWFSTASPMYYEIASQTAPSMNLQQSTESGEVLISKKTHLRTLLLCTYYNFWGPSHYYPLLSQGASGEGDKETFIAAAMAVGEPFYQVSEPICAIGHRTEGGLAGSAMVQFDPTQDYALTQKGEFRVNGSTAAAPRAFFIHANFPKFNPATVFSPQAVNPALEDDGVTYTRAWTIPQEVIREFPTDVERQFWKEILWTACELEDKFRSWKGQKGICAGVQKYWDAIFVGQKASKDKD
ncbi:hypothetical protein ASPWEDRAFT_24391 [Aspergillus wentii DTO 134E9]|uniref:Alpha-1,2-mannosyltransferase n=1 Tax=Aspergillus wentii DTO 134E9 TaxID=1073089 RepID=A0A1L9RU60_ASPWE|nr:uncharacterized protein ASPWEDRAFT_24391 [Aspergillus wentii DTO 134E9]KAI9934087.1 hypothetical protein MW887_005160 [Aspergillus wentii]OJJ38462.1 hypothetical protein ASPWEDRAFT_24391 [Aspergillus wentii DTO 134E9]